MKYRATIQPIGPFKTEEVTIARFENVDGEFTEEFVSFMNDIHPGLDIMIYEEEETK